MSLEPLFTIHAGEYLVGAHIEQTHPQWRVWLPTQDTGIDLLVTDSRRRRTLALQVKYSTDFNPNHPFLIQNRLRAAGWWKHQSRKIEVSLAVFWAFVLPSFVEGDTSFIIVPIRELVQRFRAVFGRGSKRIDSYLWVAKRRTKKDEKCWEVRGLPRDAQEQIVF